MNSQILLHEHENIEDLGVNGLKIVQSKHLYRFTTDAVLLANFVSGQKNKSAVDLGAGSGVISILLAGKKNAKRVVAVEIQSQLADLCQRNIALNNLQDKIEVANCAMQTVSDIIGKNCFDTVVCNPPYRKIGSGDKQQNDSLAICRHEIAVTLLEVVQTASTLLNDKGNFFLVHQSQRLAEICYLFKQFNIEPKEILPVCPRQGAQPNLVLVRGAKGGNPDCILHQPLCILSEKGQLTSQVKKMYSME